MGCSAMHVPEVVKSFENIRYKIKGLPFDKAMEVFKREFIEVSLYYEVSPEYIFNAYIRWKNKSRLK